MKPIRIKGKNYTPTLSFVVAFGLTLLVIIGSFFLGYWIIRAQTLAQGSAAATSSPASAASVASKIALIPTLAFEGSASGDPLAALMTPDNVMNIAFMAVAFFVVLIMTVDLLFRQNVSHIVMVLVCGLLFSAYALARTIFNLAITRDHVGSGVLYLIAFAGSLLMLYFFVKKALDGDADFSYLLTGGLTLLFFFLGCATNFSLLDSYGHTGDAPFWGGYVTTRVFLLIFAFAMVVSQKSDYDPNPIQLDEFGNPIDQKKTQTTPKKGA